MTGVIAGPANRRRAVAAIGAGGAYDACPIQAAGHGGRAIRVRQALHAAGRSAHAGAEGAGVLAPAVSTLAAVAAVRARAAASGFATGLTVGAESSAATVA